MHCACSVEQVLKIFAYRSHKFLQQDSAEEDFSKSPCNNLSTNPALKSKSTSQKLEVLKEESEFISEGSQDSDLKQSTEANKISEKENASKSSKQKYR